MIIDAALVWSLAAFVIASLVTVFLVLAYMRIQRLETEVRRIVAELSKLET